MNRELYEYCLRLGDTSLILSHRLSELCGHGPILEEDLALTNISLDLLGQTRIIYSYACELQGNGANENDLAYKRDWYQFRNLLMAELPNGDFAKTILRQYFLSEYFGLVYESLLKSTNEKLRTFADKSLREVKYHIRHCKDWVLRLGLGTDISNSKLQLATNELWDFCFDLFDIDNVEEKLFDEGIGPDYSVIKEKWFDQISKVLEESKINVKEKSASLKSGSRSGRHTEHLGYILADMQFLTRAYPNSKW